MYRPTRSSLLPALAGASLLTLAACGGPVADGAAGPTGPNANNPLGGEAPIAAPPAGGKADNYISTTAQEYELTGTAHASLPSNYDELSFEEQQEAVDEAVEDRLSTVSRSVEKHIDALLEEANGDVDVKYEEEAEYFIYARDENAETSDTQVTGGPNQDKQAAFEFKLELVGHTTLVGMLAEASESGNSFIVEVKDWGEESGEFVDIEIAKTPSTDAFPKYDELFADGVYDIALHFGGDYNEGRYDLETAEWAVQTLIEDGWTNPEVDSFEDLSIDSPPFTQQLIVEGEAVEARVYVYHADLVDAANEEKLTETMETSFAERDVVIYSGHAGENAGFILDYDPRHEIDNDDFAELPLADKYQIYVFDGCRTYRTYVNDIMANPAKTFDNVNIVTTVNTTPFSAGYQVITQFVYWLTITDQAGGHIPVTWNTMLQGINKPEWDSVHYGVHGVDNGPKLNPNGGQGLACTSCDTQSSCGGGGNYCLDFGTSNHCSVACATDAACGDGYDCMPITDDPDQFYIPKQCVPSTRTCR